MHLVAMDTEASSAGQPLVTDCALHEQLHVRQGIHAGMHTAPRKVHMIGWHCACDLA